MNFKVNVVKVVQCMAQFQSSIKYQIYQYLSSFYITIKPNHKVLTKVGSTNTFIWNVFSWNDLNTLIFNSMIYVLIL